MIVTDDDDIFFVTPRALPSDIIDREVTALCRHWNRCEPDSRADFLEMAIEADGGIIEP